MLSSCASRPSDMFAFASLSHGILARVSSSSISKQSCLPCTGLLYAGAQFGLIAYSTKTGLIRFLDVNRPEMKIDNLAGLAWIGLNESDLSLLAVVVLAESVLIKRIGPNGVEELAHTSKHTKLTLDSVSLAKSGTRVAVALGCNVVVVSIGTKLDTQIFKNDEMQTAVALHCLPDRFILACGGISGRIMVHRVFKSSSTKTLLHWHSSAVACMNFLDEDYLVSGGTEGVLVLWRMDGGSTARTFLPRLGAGISSLVNLNSTSIAVLLQDGCLLQVLVPTMIVSRRFRASLPLTPSVVVTCTNGSSARLAVALENHRPGALTIVDPSGLDAERVVDVAGRFVFLPMNSFCPPALCLLTTTTRSETQ